MKQKHYELIPPLHTSRYKFSFTGDTATVSQRQHQRNQNTHYSTPLHPKLHIYEKLKWLSFVLCQQQQEDSFQSEASLSYVVNLAPFKLYCWYQMTEEFNCIHFWNFYQITHNMALFSIMDFFSAWLWEPMGTSHACPACYSGLLHINSYLFSLQLCTQSIQLTSNKKIFHFSLTFYF